MGGLYFLASAIPDVEQHIHIVIAVVVFLSLLPAIIEGMRRRSRKSEVIERAGSGTFGL